MKYTFRHIFTGLFLCVFVLLSACQNQAIASDPSSATQIFLVRHAEKTADKNDPELTQSGALRAVLLADILKDVGITHIHSTDYKRTRATAAPLAKHLGLNVASYDGRNLPDFARVLKQTQGRHLVVGHSNTTPQLVELLGGDGGTPIVEVNEYNRLYLVTVGQGGEITTLRLRFGEPPS